MLLIMTLLVAGALAVYVFLFHAMQKSHERIAAYTEDVKIAEDAVLHEVALKRTVAEIGPDLEKVRAYQISPDGVVDFIEMIEALGKESGVVATIGSVNVLPSAVAASSTVESLNLSVKFVGSWKNGMHFLTLLESLPYDLSIEGLSLSSSFDPAESEAVKTPRVLQWDGKATFTVVKQK